MEVSSRQMQLDAKLARASRFLIRPTGTFRTCWDVTLVTMVVYNAFALPFVVCFQVPQPNSVQVLDRIVDGFFYADLVVNFFSTYEVKGHLVLDNKAVAYHYLTHWFIVDLVGAFPFEVFAGESLGQAHTLQVTLLRGVKCIRLIRLARLFKFLEKIEFVSHFLKLLRLFFGFSIIAHWLACLWYLIGDTGLELDGNGTPGGWMVYYNSTGWNVYEKTFTSRYITSLYWTVTTLLTVGYGDITAHTVTEKMFAILTIVFGALISATIFGNVTMLIESMGRSEAAYREKMEAVKYYMIDLDLPDPLQARISDFYKLLWNRNRTLGSGFGSEKVLAELPQSFHQEIAGFLNQDLFDKSMVLMDGDPVFLRNLASRLKFCVSLPNDDIVKEKDQGDRLFFIRKGTVSVASERRGKLTVLKEGAFFGEIAVFSDQEFLDEMGLDQATTDAAAAAAAAAGASSPNGGTGVGIVLTHQRTATITALVNCDLYFLTASDFFSLLAHYPQYHRLFLLIALVRLKQVGYHDDEDIGQKVFLLQVRKKELRLKYHRKEKAPRRRSIIGTRRGGVGGSGPSASGGKGINLLQLMMEEQAAKDTQEGEVFEETTQQLLRRVSLIGLEPEAAEALRARHAARGNAVPIVPLTPHQRKRAESLSSSNSGGGGGGEGLPPPLTLDGMMRRSGSRDSLHDLASPSGVQDSPGAIPASPSFSSAASPSGTMPSPLMRATSRPRATSTGGGRALHALTEEEEVTPAAAIAAPAAAPPNSHFTYRVGPTPPSPSGSSSPLSPSPGSPFSALPPLDPNDILSPVPRSLLSSSASSGSSSMRTGRPVSIHGFPTTKQKATDGPDTPTTTMSALRLSPRVHPPLPHEYPFAGPLSSRSPAARALAQGDPHFGALLDRSTAIQQRQPLGQLAATAMQGVTRKAVSPLRGPTQGTGAFSSSSPSPSSAASGDARWTGHEGSAPTSVRPSSDTRSSASPVVDSRRGMPPTIAPYSPAIQESLDALAGPDPSSSGGSAMSSSGIPAPLSPAGPMNAWTAFLQRPFSPSSSTQPRKQ